MGPCTPPPQFPGHLDMHYKYSSHNCHLSVGLLRYYTIGRRFPIMSQNSSNRDGGRGIDMYT